MLHVSVMGFHSVKVHWITFLNSCISSVYNVQTSRILTLSFFALITSMPDGQHAIISTVSFSPLLRCS